MQFSNDEVRRRLRDGQRDHEATQPLFADALDRAFDPDSTIDPGDKARLVGLPDRRGFLKLGGLTIAGSALAVACVNDTKTPVQLAQTGTLPASTTTSSIPNPGSPTVDATLVLTALSLERLAVATYQTVLDKGWLVAPLLQDVAKYFQSQHRDHAGLLATTATRLGQKSDEAAVPPNAYIDTNVVQPAEATVGAAGGGEAGQTEALKLALGLEDAAQQTYTKAGGILTTASLRQAIMSIGAIEAKHYSVIAGVLNLPQVPFAFGHVVAAAPPESYVAPNGPVTESAPPTSTGPGTTARATPGTTARATPGTTSR